MRELPSFLYGVTVFGGMPACRTGRLMDTIDRGNAGCNPFEDGRASQNRLPSHCFGCGTLDAQQGRG